MTPLIDTHCHLNHSDLAADLDGILARAALARVMQIICVGYDLESSVLSVHQAHASPMIHSVVGVHPQDANIFTNAVEADIRMLAEDSAVVGIGETGLDYYRELSPRDVQKDAYRRHIRIAWEMELPLVIHSRQAGYDVLDILAEEGCPPRGAVLHCFSGDAEFAERALELGCYLGVDGPITFKNARDEREVMRELPLERLLMETDAPYLTPHPYRGKQNEPSYLPLIAAQLAEIKDISVEQVITQTTANARALFNLKIEPDPSP